MNRRTMATLSLILLISFLLSSCASTVADGVDSTSQYPSIRVVSMESTLSENGAEDDAIVPAPTVSEKKSMSRNEEILPISSGDEFVADVQGNVEKLEYEITDAPDSDLQQLILRVGDASIKLENESFQDPLYIVTMETPFGSYPVFLVSSFRIETVQTDVIVYFEGQLFRAGEIPDNTADWLAAEDGCLVDEFFRLENKYTLASTDTYFYEPMFSLSQVPEGMQACGNIVTVQKEIPIYAMRYGDAVAWTAEPRDRLVLAANDSIELIFVQSTDGSQSGWIRYNKTSGDILVADGSAIDMYEAFAGLPTWE